MKSTFRMGQLRVCPQLLAEIPRPALVAAIVEHFTTQPAYDGQPMRTVCRHGDSRFVLETPSTRDKTIISLI